jgi:hypothetical protein
MHKRQREAGGCDHRPNDGDPAHDERLGFILFRLAWVLNSANRFHNLDRYCYKMQGPFVAFIMLGAITSSADDLRTLKAAARRYVASMKAVPALPDAPDCSETIAKAGEYAAAKMAYYQAAGQAMPALLQIAKGEKTDSRFGNELTEIFRGFGEDKDKEITRILGKSIRDRSIVYPSCWLVAVVPISSLLFRRSSLNSDLSPFRLLLPSLSLLILLSINC